MILSKDGLVVNALSLPLLPLGLGLDGLLVTWSDKEVVPGYTSFSLQYDHENASDVCQQEILWSVTTVYISVIVKHVRKEYQYVQYTSFGHMPNLSLLLLFCLKQQKVLLIDFVQSHNIVPGQNLFCDAKQAIWLKSTKSHLQMQCWLNWAKIYQLYFCLKHCPNCITSDMYWLFFCISLMLLAQGTTDM